MSYSFPRLNVNRWVKITFQRKVFWADRKESIQTAAWVKALVLSLNRVKLTLLRVYFVHWSRMVLSLFSSSIYSCLSTLCWCRYVVVVAGEMDGFDVVVVVILSMWILFLYSSMLLFFAIDVMFSCVRMFLLSMLPAAYGSLRIWSRLFTLSFSFNPTHVSFIFLAPIFPSHSVSHSPDRRVANKKREKWHRMIKKFFQPWSPSRKKRFSRQEKKYRDLSLVLSLRIVRTHAPSPSL